MSDNLHHRPENGTSHSDRMAEFAGALLNPEKSIPPGVGKESKPAPKRFAVYRNNVVVSLMEALGQAYPSIKAIMGEDNFALVARKFVALHPPRSAMMQHFGGEFSEFLSTFPPLAKSPFLADVAKAERAWLDAWHGIDYPALDPVELATIGPEETMGLTFSALPATRLIRSKYPLADLFDARSEWPKPGIDLTNPQNLLITRPHLECTATALSQADADFTDAVLSGTTLGDAVSATLEKHEEFNATSAIAILLQTGALQSRNTASTNNQP